MDSKMCMLWVVLFAVSSADGRVGCLFSANVCYYSTQWCYDDFAFGQCLSNDDSPGNSDFYRYDLGLDALNLLEYELLYLHDLEYTWSHSYAQCIVKAVLASLRYDVPYLREVCEPWREPESPLDMDPKDMAIVRYTPSDGNAHPDFADEVYFPPEDNAVDVADSLSLGYNYLSKKSLGASPLRRSPLLPPSGMFSPLYNTADKFRGGLEAKGSNNLWDPTFTLDGVEVDNLAQLQEVLMKETLLSKERNSVPESNNPPEEFLDGQETRAEGQEMTLDHILNRASEVSPAVEGPAEPYDSGPVGQVANPSQRLSPKLGRLAGLLYAPRGDAIRAAGYTEGGLVRLPEDQDMSPADDIKVRREGEDIDDGLDDLLLGFKRPERLDVKKPGPQFTALNLAEQQHQQADGGSTDVPNTSSAGTNQLETPSSAQWSLPKHLLAQKKELNPPDVAHDRLDGGQYDVVDTTYAYIGFKKSVKSWQEGKKIVRSVARLLGLPSSSLSQERVDRNEVTFKVLPNPLGMNASEVAKRIEGIKVYLNQRTGVEVTSAGIGDKTKLPTVLSLEDDSDNQLYVATLLICGGIGFMLLAAVGYFFIRRRAKTRAKLQALPRQDPEASKDYQELCRARMSTKTAQEKPEPIGNRIASLSRESEGSNNSPSSRSSTSSWSEEPAHTNMDISTGHMVLSYMEDHLKNKDRLEREWVALCAYEAEPCATAHALKPENIKKNRFNNVLPYDHSRVVLNDLANISGSDYINASTITDHDPRNPAYIATQGSLPHTAADFWQLVWEQGSVVMVMLTRLTENGNAMCHRYWPEEGSELYHIYEVHLVSEHIWCDDYLVRSFYLKNLKTGETRTVTQFHFLSWPDNGVPHSTKALLEFRRKVNKSYRGRSCPIVVHCSDGVGRAGTYCVIDMVLNRMAKGAKEIDIAATLEHIRDQRANMVKTKQQFEFVLTAVAEEVNAILKALPAQLPPPTVQPAMPVPTVAPQ